MQVVITVTEFPSMPGRYQYALAINNRRVSQGNDCGRCPESAAAKAISLAIAHKGNYVIFAPRKVLDCIPENLRQGRMV